MRRYGLVDIPTEASDINAVPITNDGVISGGIVTWTGTGLIFNVSACNYILNGLYYSSPFTTITLDAADATYTRIDVFAVNTSSQVVFIKGTPALNPVEPEGDTETTLGLTNVTINANATTPNNVTKDLIYDENASSPTEWSHSSDGISGYTVNFADTTQFYTGSKSIKVTKTNYYVNTTYLKGSTINTSTYQSLTFAIRIVNNWNFPTETFILRFYNGTTPVASFNITQSNTIGFVPTIINQWQLLTIPLSSITFSQNIFNQIAIYTGGGTNTYWLDTIKLNGGINNPGGSTSTISFGFVNGSTGTASATIATDTLNVVGTGLATTSATGKTLTIAVPTPIPSQTGNTGKFLTTNGTAVSWANPTDNGITSLNLQTGVTQTFATGTSGTDFGISSATNTHTFNIPTASATNRGALSSTDWTTFNNKESALTFSSPLSRSVNTISIPVATTSINGYLSSTDWTTFNGKQAALNGTGFVKISGTTISYDNSTYITGNQSITLSGDISGTGTTAITTTIGANKVTNAMLAQVATGTFHGRVTAATGNVETLTGTQATTLLDVFSSTLKGLVPLSGGGTTNFLRADGTWAAAGGGTTIYTGDGTLTSNRTLTHGGFNLSLVGSSFTNRFTSAGRLLIGTTTESTYILDVVGTARVSGQLTVTGSTTAASAIARGAYYTPTLVAAANGDVLVGLDISPTFTNGAFTGVSNISLRTTTISATQITLTGGAGVPILIPTAGAIRVNAAGGTMYIDAGTDLAGNINIRATTTSVSGTLSCAGFSTGNNNANIGTSAGTGVQIAGQTVLNINSTSTVLRFNDNATYNSVGMRGTAYQINDNTIPISMTFAASALLEVNSTIRGFLPPRMTTTQKNAIGTPAAGLIVFDTTLAKLCVYSGSAWQTITSV